jgi:hypothetical protein
MPFCSNCGAPLKEQQSFCQSCGTPVSSIQPQTVASYPPPPPSLSPLHQVPQYDVPSEILQFILTEIDLIPNKQDRPRYTLILTDRRIIFAKLTQQIRLEADQMMQVNDQGKGFWGKWKSQVSGHNWVLDRYKNNTPEQALRESPENFAFDHNSIRSVLIKYWSDDQGDSEYYFEMQTDSQLIKFRTIRNYEKEFEQVYAKRVTRKTVS